MLSQDVRSSVCHIWNSAKMAKRIVKLFHHLVATPFWFYHTLWQYSDSCIWCPLTGASDARGYEKIAIFDKYPTLSRKWYKIELSSQWPTDRKSYTVYEWHHFQWPWTIPNTVFKVTPFFDAEYLRNGMTVWDTDSYIKILRGTYALLKSVILNIQLHEASCSLSATAELVWNTVYNAL